MRQENLRQLVLGLILLITLSGCDTSRQPTPSSLSDNGPFMALWSTYTNCLRSEDLDAKRADAQRLIRAVHTIGSAEDPIPIESHEPFHVGPSVRLSIDPREMAAACALHAGQVAREMGHLSMAREMFRMVVLHFPQPRYQYYAGQARRGLEHLDATSLAALSGLILERGANMTFKRREPWNGLTQPCGRLVPLDVSKTTAMSEPIVKDKELRINMTLSIVKDVSSRETRLLVNKDTELNGALKPPIFTAGVPSLPWANVTLEP